MGRSGCSRTASAGFSPGKSVRRSPSAINHLSIRYGACQVFSSPARGGHEEHEGNEEHEEENEDESKKQNDSKLTHFSYLRSSASIHVLNSSFLFCIPLLPMLLFPLRVLLPLRALRVLSPPCSPSPPCAPCPLSTGVDPPEKISLSSPSTTRRSGTFVSGNS